MGTTPSSTPPTYDPAVKSLGQVRSKKFAALAAAALVVLFGGFLLGRSLTKDDDDAPSQEQQVGVITFAEGARLKTGLTSSSVIARLGQPAEVERRRFPKGRTAQCLNYDIQDQPGDTWQFCFLRGKLVSGATLLR
jgi:hypothetical protein